MTEIRVRTDNHILTAKLHGKFADALWATLNATNTKQVQSKKENAIVLQITDDLSFMTGYGDDLVEVMLYENFYVVKEN